MFEESKIILMGATLVLVFGMLSSALMRGLAQPESQSVVSIGSWACTADVEICPDGREVYRVPPYCQFADCVSE